MEKSQIPSRRDRRKNSLWPWLALILCFFIAAVAGVFYASSQLASKTKPPVVKPPKKTEALLELSDKTTVMIMGVDEREDDVGRSDTLMVAMLDPNKNQASLLSIPRDTRVKIRGYGFDKINAAYAYGGYPLTRSTVENFIGVPIEHYVMINVHSFVAIIDAIGGVDIDVEKRMYYEDPWDDDGGLLIDLKPGLQHMDGKTAVTYVRYRDEEGDIGRINRQQKFMRACMEKVTSPSIITSLPGIIREVMAAVDTDLSLRELMELAGTLKNSQQHGLKTDMVPGRPLYIDGISYWIPDISAMRYTVADTLDVTMSSSMLAEVTRADQEYASSIPARATEVPAYDTSIGRASHYTPSHSAPRRERYTSSEHYSYDDEGTGSSDDNRSDHREGNSVTAPRQDSAGSERVREPDTGGYEPAIREREAAPTPSQERSVERPVEPAPVVTPSQAGGGVGKTQ